MVRSLIRVAAAATVMSAATAFAPTTPASFGVRSAPLSPTNLQAATYGSGYPSVLDGPSSVVLDRPAVEQETERNADKFTERHMSPPEESILRIYNDNVNTREYVAVCLVQVVGLCETRAYHTMQDAHHNGIAKVGEYNQEVAECYEEQLNERGIVCDVVSSSGE